MKKLLVFLILLNAVPAHATVVKFLDPGTDSTFGLEMYGVTSTSNGTIASSSTVAHTGPRSIKSDVTMAGGRGGVRTPAASIADAGGVMCEWVYFSSVSPSTNTGFIDAENSGLTRDIFDIALTTTGKIMIQFTNSTAKTGNTVLSATTWYQVCVGWVITTTSNWSATVYLNGASEVTTSNADGTLGGVGVDHFMLGIFIPGNQSSITSTSILTVYFDDVYIDNRTDKSYPGSISVTAKLPLSNGTTNGFTGTGTPSGTGTGNARYVNERALSATNFVSASVSAITTEEYNIEGASAGDVNLTGATLVEVAGWVYAKAALAETGSIRLNNVDSNISLINANTMFVVYGATTTYPAGTGTDIGIITTNLSTTVTLFEAGVNVAYIPAAVTSVRNGLTLMGVR